MCFSPISAYKTFRKLFSLTFHTFHILQTKFSVSNEKRKARRDLKRFKSSYQHYIRNTHQCFRSLCKCHFPLAVIRETGFICSTEKPGKIRKGNLKSTFLA